MRYRLPLLALVVALLAVAWASGAFRTFSDVQAVRALLASWGTWAYVLYLASFTILQPLGIPALFWVVLAAILWPFWVGSSSHATSRDWAAARLSPRLRRFDQRLAAHGLRAVILIRLVFMLSAPTHWLLGLSHVGYGAFALGTVLGSIPNLVLVTYFGEKTFLWFGGAPA